MGLEMGNKFFNAGNRANQAPKKGHPTGMGAASKPGFPVRPAFGNIGVPGKTQPKDRSGGVKRVPIHPRSVGL